MSITRYTDASREWEQRYRTLTLNKQIKPGEIRAFLRGETTIAAHVFLQLLVPLELHDIALRRRWDRGVRALYDLQTYTWGAKQKLVKFTGLVADPEILAAFQGAVARGTEATMDMLGVLALDGGTDSIDALLPHLDPALVASDTRLELLQRLRTYAAPTPAIQAIFGEIEATLAQRAAASPALALATAIGIGTVPRLTFDVSISSTTLNRSNVPVLQGNIDIDSRSAAWFSVHLSRMTPDHSRSPSTYFRADAIVRDDLGVGRCDAKDLPQWIAAAAKVVAMELRIGEPRTNLRGTKRAQLMRWLRGE